MAFDDPIVWILILGVVVFLFGSSKIPQFARSLGQARKEFDSGWKGLASEITKPPTETQAPPATTTAVPPAASAASVSEAAPGKDPLIVACESEGITTIGKTREQLASELSWKLNKK
ncbi:MAG: twin-arginine translocase TatA/TatE family subunit [Nitrososphaerota archaeon]|nr:twin-arginine translocase TatA/TatE family subunit [Nitrososphaerota archaeon]